MVDLTVLYYTANKIPEVFATNIRNQILSVINDLPIISISHKPIDFGNNICVGDIGVSVFNLYRQVLIGAKVAKTEYVVLCEDDCLYTRGHFTCYRPPKNLFGYNHNKWGLYVWEKNPIFSYKFNRSVLSQCIAPRKLLIESLTERFNAGIPENETTARVFAEPGRYERHFKRFNVTIREKEAFESPEPNVILSHTDCLQYATMGTHKGHGTLREKKLAPWGKASDVLRKYLGEEEWIRQQNRQKKLVEPPWMGLRIE
jgi:hypothetical protein